MKSFVTKLALVTAVIGACISNANAEDALTVAPAVYKKVMENTRVRVMEANFKPRDKIASHSQAEHLFYVLTDGTLVIQTPGRTAYEMTFKAGESFWLPAQTRSIENDGDAPVKALIVEVKGASAGTAATTGRKSAGRRGNKSRRARRR